MRGSSSVPWWAKAGACSSWLLGSAAQAWMPNRRCFSEPAAWPGACEGLAPAHQVGLARLALGMHDAAPRRHQVDLARPDRRYRAQAVAVPHLALEQEGHRGEPDVRVRAHVDAIADQELRGPHLVEEDERPDHLLLRRRQRAAHLEGAKIAGARHDHMLDGIAGELIAGHGVLGRQPAHASPLLSSRPKRNLGH